MNPEQNMSLFDDPVLFRAWGTDWSVTKFCPATGACLLLLAGLSGWILASHTKGAKWETLSSREAADLAVNAGRAPHERFGQIYAGKAVGAKKTFANLQVTPNDDAALAYRLGVPRSMGWLEALRFRGGEAPRPRGHRRLHGLGAYSDLYRSAFRRHSIADSGRTRSRSDASVTRSADPISVPAWPS
jgi:hypothetical protein